MGEMRVREMSARNERRGVEAGDESARVCIHTYICLRTSPRVHEIECHMRRTDTDDGFCARGELCDTGANM